MGISMALVLVISFTITAFSIKSSTIASLAGASWVLFGAFCYMGIDWTINYWTDWHYYMAIFSLLAGLPIMIIYALETRADTEGAKITEDEEEFDTDDNNDGFEVNKPIRRGMGKQKRQNRSMTRAIKNAISPPK